MPIIIKEQCGLYFCLSLFRFTGGNINLSGGDIWEISWNEFRATLMELVFLQGGKRMQKIDISRTNLVEIMTSPFPFPPASQSSEFREINV